MINYIMLACRLSSSDIKTIMQQILVINYAAHVFTTLQPCLFNYSTCRSSVCYHVANLIFGIDDTHHGFCHACYACVDHVWLIASENCETT